MGRTLTALVIGNAKYDNASVLKNPSNDANDVAEKLVTSGFSVTRLIDASHKEMDRALQCFKKNSKGADVALFFFAGHGIQIEGDNYLCATDTKIDDETEAKHSSMSLNRVIESMEKSKTTTNLIILDACRDNPWDRAWRRPTSRGLASVYAPKGTLVAFATSPGQLAADGKGKNGAYTAALLQHIETPNCSIEMMFKRVRNTLSATTSQKQISWEHTSLAEEFYFNPSIGARITEYSPTSLSDGLFVLDEAKVSHQLIRALKSLTWPKQNPALTAFTASHVAKAGNDSLFVVGRNIYQAACGSSSGAINYINDFMNRTNSAPVDKRKALLDGMLFEIFFGSDGEIRGEPKMPQFEQVFHLQQYNDLSSSFDFIAECLIPYASRYYAIPGTAHTCAVDIMVEPKSQNKITAVFVEGKNVLRAKDEDYADENGAPTCYRSYSIKSLEKTLAEQMIFPQRQLKFTYNEARANLEKIQFPEGWTVRKKWVWSEQAALPRL